MSILLVSVGKDVDLSIKYSQITAEIWPQSWCIQPHGVGASPSSVKPVLWLLYCHFSLLPVQSAFKGLQPGCLHHANPQLQFQALHRDKLGLGEYKDELFARFIYMLTSPVLRPTELQYEVLGPKDLAQ